jgi:hypothetical protein
MWKRYVKRHAMEQQKQMAFKRNAFAKFENTCKRFFVNVLKIMAKNHRNNRTCVLFTTKKYMVAWNSLYLNIIHRRKVCAKLLSAHKFPTHRYVVNQWILFLHRRKRRQITDSLFNSTVMNKLISFDSFQLKQRFFASWTSELHLIQRAQSYRILSAQSQRRRVIKYLMQRVTKKQRLKKCEGFVSNFVIALHTMHRVSSTS